MDVMPADIGKISDTAHMVGWTLIVAGVMDVLVAVIVLAPKLEQSEHKALVLGSVALSGVGMLIAGALLLTGVVVI